MPKSNGREKSTKIRRIKFSPATPVKKTITKINNDEKEILEKVYEILKQGETAGNENWRELLPFLMTCSKGVQNNNFSAKFASLYFTVLVTYYNKTPETSTMKSDLFASIKNCGEIAKQLVDTYSINTNLETTNTLN